MQTYLHQFKNFLTSYSRLPIFGILLLSIFYLVGIVGIVIIQYEDFILLTPFNLLVSLVIVLYYHPEWKRATIFSLLLSYFVGFFIEMIGVNTGVIFGAYTYGKVLGWKIWGTPLMIGVNWALLIYSVGMTVNWVLPKLHWIIKATIGASLMLALDFLIEPVAIHYDFWTWENVAIPLQNYISWWLISFGLLLFFHFYHRKQKNKVGSSLLAWQFLFFAILYATM